MQLIALILYMWCYYMLMFSNSVQGLSSVNEKWQAWKQEHGKLFSTEQEETQRMEIWMNNLAAIQEHNRHNHSFTLAMNHFGDLV